MPEQIKRIREILKASADSNPERFSIFFKKGIGEYAQHDKFMGISVPVLRKIAKEFLPLSLEELSILIRSPINEERLLALIILTHNYKSSTEAIKENLYQFYLHHLPHINNWNLVDSSAHLIVGAHLFGKEKGYLIELATSNSLWERRIAIVSTWYFIRRNDLKWTFKIAALLQKDTHDLIHKAVGWMLREAGKKNISQLISFLEIYAPNMPRTMLRYAIEKFPEQQRRAYLQKTHTPLSLPN